MSDISGLEPVSGFWNPIKISDLVRYIRYNIVLSNLVINKSVKMNRGVVGSLEDLNNGLVEGCLLLANIHQFILISYLVVLIYLYIQIISFLC
jgi:hypothetical protein